MGENASKLIRWIAYILIVLALMYGIGVIFMLLLPIFIAAGKLLLVGIILIVCIFILAKCT
jgi:hypothetical protein